jgi:twitching motility protein PilI
MSDVDASRDSQDLPPGVAQPASAPSWLAVECAGQGLLLPLKQAAEIFTPVPIQPLPHAQPWLAGVANLRGGLFTVVDLAVFLGLREAVAGSRDNARLVALHADLQINTALLVDGLLGLRGEAQLRPAPEPASAMARPRFAGPLWLDAEQRSWQVLDLDALSRHESFLRVVV